MMNKKTFLVVTLIMIMLCFSVNAQNGQAVGNYYSTDIVTTLNGQSIDCVNIGGQTLINAENMCYYGFSVDWNNEQRRLDITSLSKASNGTPPYVTKSQSAVGEIIGNYYKTDIKTYIDGKEILSYNIGGKTYIHAENTCTHGFRVLWDQNSRTLSLESPYYAGYCFNKLLSYGKAQSTDAVGGFSITYNKEGLFGTQDVLYSTISFSSSAGGYCISLGYYQNAGLFHSSQIFDLLEPLVSGGNAYPIFEPEKKYELVNQNIVFKINGIQAKEVALSRYNGNGHKTFYIYAYDLPHFTQQEINEIFLSVGNTNNQSEFSMEMPEQSICELILQKFKTHPFDYINTHSFESKTVASLNIVESLGNYKTELYIVDNQTLEMSDDILKQIRMFSGFDYSYLQTYGYTSGSDLSIYGLPKEYYENYLVFGCTSDSQKGAFILDLETMLADKLW